MVIKPEELQAKIESNGQLVILDVRSRFEYLSGHLPGAIHLPFWKILFRIQQVVSDKSTQSVLYCEHGPRAIIARQAMLSRGYQHVSCLKGHMHSWRLAGRPIERPVKK